MVVDGEALVRSVVVDGEAQEAGIGGKSVQELEAQLFLKKEFVVASSDGIPPRKPGYGAVETVAGENDIVTLAQVVHDMPELLLVVRLVQIHLERLILGDTPWLAVYHASERQIVVPVLQSKRGARGQIAVDPIRGLYTAVRPGVDAGEGQRIKHRAANHDSCDPIPDGRSTSGHRTLSPFQPSSKRIEHLGAHDEEEGEQGQHVAHELHHEAAGDQEVGSDPSQHQEVHTPSMPRYPPQEESEAAVRDHPQRQAHGPEDAMLYLVQKGRRVDVLSRVGIVGDTPHHPPLFGHASQESIKVQHRVGLSDE